MKSGYRWCLHDLAYEALAGLAKRRQRMILNSIRDLAGHPFRAPAFTGFDDEGFEVAIVYAADCMIGYHVDHAVRTVQVREITPIP